VLLDSEAALARLKEEKPKNTGLQPKLKKDSLYSIILQAFSNHPTEEGLRKVIEDLKVKIPELEAAIKNPIPEGQGDADDLCCSNDFRQSRDCLKDATGHYMVFPNTDVSPTDADAAGSAPDAAPVGMNALFTNAEPVNAMKQAEEASKAEEAAAAKAQEEADAKAQAEAAAAKAQEEAAAAKAQEEAAAAKAKAEAAAAKAQEEAAAAKAQEEADAKAQAEADAKAMEEAEKVEATKAAVAPPMQEITSAGTQFQQIPQIAAFTVPVEKVPEMPQRQR